MSGVGPLPPTAASVAGAAPAGTAAKTLETPAGRDALLGVYAPPAPVFVAGEGSWLVDEDGRRYLDFTSGIGVTALGHGAPAVRDAVAAALETGLVHTSNLFRTGPAEALARELSAAAGWGRVFFCNSGGEAGEAALKFARKWARASGAEGKTGVVAFHGGFHGRLFGTLAATDRPAWRAPFEPLMPGVSFCPVGDVDAVARSVTRHGTAAVIVEPVQGEGGVRPVSADFLRELRALCDEREVTLIFDEVQCGLGRTGRLLACERAGVRPDLLTLAKPLAGGLPMGAVLVGERIADVMAPGDHGTTFGGGPLVASAARAVLATLTASGFLEGVRERSALLEARLRATVRGGRVREVRGVGMMWGLDLPGPAAGAVERARDAGLLVCTAGSHTVRLLPPLTVSAEEIDRGVELLEEVL